MRPPRTLWVPFPLGRPFGVPDNPAFQRKVLVAALALRAVALLAPHHEGAQLPLRMIVRRLDTDAVEVQGLLRLTRDVQNFGGLSLHLEGEIVGLNARAKLAVKTMTPLRFPRYLDRDPRELMPERDAGRCRDEHSRGDTLFETTHVVARDRLQQRDLRLPGNDRLVAHARVDVDYVPAGASESFILVFSRDPTDGRLVVVPTGFVKD